MIQYRKSFRVKENVQLVVFAMVKTGMGIFQMMPLRIIGKMIISLFVSGTNLFHPSFDHLISYFLSPSSVSMTPTTISFSVEADLGLNNLFMLSQFIGNVFRFFIRIWVCISAFTIQMIFLFAAHFGHTRRHRRWISVSILLLSAFSIFVSYFIGARLSFA